MTKEDLIIKWLDHNLSPEEQKAFSQLEDHESLIQINKVLKHFKAPNFDVDDHHHRLKPQLTQKATDHNIWWKTVLKIAAVLVLGFSLYYYTTSLDTNFKTEIAEHASLKLPDASVVELNSNSSMTFNKGDWDSKRAVNLNGEAYFKVAKGKKFDVVTDGGKVSVLGTEFNVKQRQSFFEVTCYEGWVAVSFNHKTIDLHPGQTLRTIDGKLNPLISTNSSKPNWLKGESSFKKVPLHYVLSEIENQYDVNINVENIDIEREFTGSFTHKNLDLALQSVTIPLNLKFSIAGKSIVIARD